MELNNLTKGNNNNCLINGRKQELGNGLNNSAIIAGSGMDKH